MMGKQPITVMLNRLKDSYLLFLSLNPYYTTTVMGKQPITAMLNGLKDSHLLYYHSIPYISWRISKLNIYSFTHSSHPFSARYQTCN